MMNNRGISIRYGDVAPEAKENFKPTSDFAKFDTLAQLQQYNLNFPNYANPCELYSVVLDGTATAFPSVPEQANLGLWSEQISNDDGTFTEPIVLELKSAGQYSSQGLTLTFDTYNGIHPTRLSIKWLRITNEGITILDEKEFAPNNAVYFCRNFVKNYNKVVITFYSLNMPKNRLKLRVIDYGHGTSFNGKELRGVNIITKIDPISSQININTADITIVSDAMSYSFQTKQPLSIYYNGKLHMTTYVKAAKRKSRSIYQVQSEDYIGIMDGVYYSGGIYNEVNAYELLVDIFNTAKVPYEINESLKDVSLSGYIPYTTCREALMQVAFATQNVVDTIKRDNVAVYEIAPYIKQKIPLNRIRQGQNFEDDDTVTRVEIAVHSYTPINDTIGLYKSDESGTGNDIFIKFFEPVHDLTISNGTIVESGTNYAIINADSGCVLQGQRYKDTIRIIHKDNPTVLANEMDKIVAINGATLVSMNNIDNILAKCYNWLTRTRKVNLGIVEGKHIQYGEHVKYGQVKYGEAKYNEKLDNVVTYDMPTCAGDNIAVETEYMGELEGIIASQRYNLNGNIIVKQSEVYANVAR